MKKATLEGEAYAPVDDVYDFFMDFENYGKYSGYVKNVRVVADNDEYTEWEIDFQWWIVRYTARSRLVEYEENDYIEWRVTKDVDVRGVWNFEEEEDDDGNPVTQVKLELWYDPEGASKANPLRYFPTDQLIALAKPVVARHVNKVLKRVTEELEGEPREVNFTLKYEPSGGKDEFLDLVPSENENIQVESER